MARYFFHLREGDTLFTDDDEGEELPDLDAVHTEPPGVLAPQEGGFSAWLAWQVPNRMTICDMGSQCSLTDSG
jgi:uncharacterized protein DUF6894